MLFIAQRLLVWSCTVTGGWEVVYPRCKVMFEELRAHRDEIEEMGRRYGV